MYLLSLKDFLFSKIVFLLSLSQVFIMDVEIFQYEAHRILQDNFFMKVNLFQYSDGNLVN